MKPKWVMDSMTIWGTVVTGVSAALPALNAFLTYFTDWTIEPAWIEAVNEGVKSFIMGLGTIVGVTMVVWGRWRASQPLSLMRK